MKITGLETIMVEQRWMFLKLHTDTDIYGLGEPVLEGHCTSSVHFLVMSIIAR